MINFYTRIISLHNIEMRVSSRAKFQQTKGKTAELNMKTNKQKQQDHNNRNQQNDQDNKDNANNK